MRSFIAASTAAQVRTGRCRTLGICVASVYENNVTSEPVTGLPLRTSPRLHQSSAEQPNAFFSSGRLPHFGQWRAHSPEIELDESLRRRPIATSPAYSRYKSPFQTHPRRLCKEVNCANHRRTLGERASANARAEQMSIAGPKWVAASATANANN